MTSSALVVSDDLIFRSNARQVLSNVGISCISSGKVGFNKTVISAKFDAVILDYPDIDEIVAAIHSVRTGKVNRYSIILALVSDSRGMAAARSAGANFTIQRSPTICEDLERAVQSAYALILRERRRYERHPVSLTVEILCNGRSASGTMIDISECGACIECSPPPDAESLQLGFLLPGLDHPLRVEGITAWARGSKLGIKFTSVEESAQIALLEWLRSQHRLGPPASL
ncbi:MAG TPA: PilZ domain-containing protein [Terriglobales bacterium]|nr:PilZ domain-containing protein [Terriglobales bacterium]